MRLMHYSELALPFGPMDYVQNELRAFGKPTGYWVSVQGEDDWPTWCRENEFFLGGLTHAYEVTLAPDANVLMLDSVEASRGIASSSASTRGTWSRRSTGSTLRAAAGGCRT